MKRLLPLLLLAVCAGTPPEPVLAKPAASWHATIRDADRKRLAGLWSAWTRSLHQAHAAGEGAQVTALGVLGDPEAARPAPPPAPGNYRCRNIKIGKHEGVPATVPAFVATGFLPCTVTALGQQLWFEQVNGMQRIGGTLFADGDRMIFLGAMALTGEGAMMRYGLDPDRDQVGVLRAVGDHHWRLELPWPNWQANLEVIEILPA